MDILAFLGGFQGVFFVEIRGYCSKDISIQETIGPTEKLGFSG